MGQLGIDPGAVEHTTWVLWCGFAAGVVFGAVGQYSGFCLTRGLRGWWRRGDGRALRAFALALAVAIAGSQAVGATGWVALPESLYLEPTFSWLLMPLGGLLFGYGMVLANGCGSRALVLLGSGNLRSFVVLVCLGLTAYAVLTGVLAPLRVWALEHTALVPGFQPPDLAALLGEAGLGDALARWLPVVVLSGGLAAFALAGNELRRSPREWMGGGVIGLLVPVGWLITGHLGADDFEPVTLASLTFVAPVGESLQYLMLATGTRLEFGVATVGGVLAGAGASAVARGTFRLQGFSGPGHMLRSMAGGALMGAGGALALGCSIGQGLTGLSTLSVASFLSVAGILTGATLALVGPLRLADGDA